MSEQAYLQMRGLRLAYGETVAVEKLDLDIARGELVAFLGPSGCGKTTTMRAIAGLLKPAAGTIALDGRDITNVPANRRQVGLVFQSYALFPHLSVFENVAFGLRLKHLPPSEIEERVLAALTTVGLTDLRARQPSELSGGQQQRVALARSLVMEPKLLLLDEPLSNLDARLRLEMRSELQRVQMASELTMIFVTHDQGEAMALADRIVVMNNGLIEQIGSPQDIYERPISRFVADFVGFENIFEVQDGRLQTPVGETELPQGFDAAGLAWRPGKVRLGEGPYQGEVLAQAFAGNCREYLLQSAIGTIKAETSTAEPPYAVGTKIAFDLPFDGAVCLDRFG